MTSFINKYDLFIFDMNNCIIDLEKYHYKAWLITLQNIFGTEFILSYDYFCENFHPKDSDCINTFLLKLLNNYDIVYPSGINKIMNDKNKIYLDLLSQEKDNIKLIDGVDNIINLIINNNKKFIIISDTFKSNLPAILDFKFNK
jgi:beta-phosphoglucomutase-like phosphatase (HAD superfamily)